ncbi:hypothetical protein [Priestia aryabhattai]
MIKFLLGVADAQSSNAQVSQQDFTELEKTMLEKIKDLQDVANGIQGDQISFLKDQISSFFTWTGIAVTIALAVITAITAGFQWYSKKLSQEAEAKMAEATQRMNEAKALQEEAKDKISFLEQKQQELKDLLDSQALNDKLRELEKSALITAKLEKQAQGTINIQTAKNVLEETIKECKKYRQFITLSTSIKDGLDDLDSKCEKLAFLLSKTILETSASSQHPHLFNEEQVLGETNGILKQVFRLKEEVNKFYEYEIEPIVDRRKEKGE